MPLCPAIWFQRQHRLPRWTVIHWLSQMLQQTDTHSACTHSLLLAQGSEVTGGTQLGPDGSHSDSFPKDMHDFFCALATPPLSLGTPLLGSSCLRDAGKLGNGTASAGIIQLPTSEHPPCLYYPLTLPPRFWKTIEGSSLFLFRVW